MKQQTGAAVRIEIKALDESGRFSGWASKYGIIDHGKDKVMPGSSAKRLMKSTRVQLLLQHDADKPIGEGILEEKADGLWLEGQIDLDDPMNFGRFAHHKMLRGELGALSIGYLVPEGGAKRSNGVRELHEIEVIEVSPVVFPMNDQATIETVKQRAEIKIDDFATTLARVTMYTKHSLMMQALYSCLERCMWDWDSTNEEKVSTIDSSIGQFSAEYMAWAREYYADDAEEMKAFAALLVEVKSGRRISAASRVRIEKAIEELSTLIKEDDGADDEGEKSQQVAEPVPVPDLSLSHISALNCASDIRSILSA